MIALSKVWTQIPKNIQIIIVVGFLFSINFPIYFLINKYSVSQDGYRIPVFIDNVVPFLPWTIIIYPSVFFFILIPVFLVRDKIYFYQMVKAQLTLLVISNLIFIFFPVHISRPMSLSPDKFLEWGVLLGYWLDNPTSCFPSLHVSIAYLAGFAAYRMNKTVGIITYIGATLISISTLTLKAHFFLDVVGGFALAWIVDFIFLRKVSLKNLKDDDKPRPGYNALLFLAVYGFFVMIMFILYQSGFKIPISQIAVK
jgi:membrane-associated phospholipid phosphatase